MDGYVCKGCGGPASVVAGVISRACACTVGVVAPMKATAYGEGHAKDSKMSEFAKWFIALIRARRK